MRTSIRKIFNNWKLQSAILTVLLGAVAFTALLEHNSFDKVNNLKNQKELVFFITEIGRNDLELASVQYRGKSTQLHFEPEKLQTLNGRDILGQYFLGHSGEYAEDLEKLKLLAVEFTDSAGKWYAEDNKDLKQREKEMINARNRILVHIDRMIQTNASYDYDKFMIQQALIYLALLQALLMLAIFVKKFALIQRDVSSLYAIDSTDADGEPYVIMTEEVDTISKRMHRKPQASENPAMIDPVTEINNHKGMLYAFSNKRSMKDGNYVTVCLFEIDGFKELDKKYPKTFTQAVLKKIAFMISLYEQHTDVIARTDYNQFAVILSRSKLEQSLHDFEQIRASVEETAFKVPKGETIRLTVTGGFATKLDSATLDETIQQAQQVLDKSRAKGLTNHISQLTDLI